jgi:serine/threonine-protein kinase
MDAETWGRVERVLDLVLTREPSEWPRILDQTCSDNPELRGQVEALLDEHERLGDFLHRRPSELFQELGAAAPMEGRRIGAYRLVRPIGRGGMSRVYLAERADGAFEQQVAVKLLRADLDSELDLARFRAERQILASLNHPNIARLLDGGVTDAGQPYLVLEYVDGQPLDRHCQARGLGVRERIALFRSAAEAVRYAHRALVVHRDLKPSNILVSADGTVKLLDFGLAKLLERETSASPTTRPDQRWMTPEYAAPEQIRGLQITTLTDVYQLGAVLYELLAECRPFPGHRSLHELEDAVLHQDPAPPSSVRPSLGGDLDAIVLQALRKEPDRRYQSVEALLEDLRHFQDGLPVRARQASPGYRLRKFVGRHRTAVATGSLAVLALVGATGFSIAQMREARRQRDQATEDARHSQALTTVLTVVAGTPRLTGDRMPTPMERIERAAEVLQRSYGQYPGLVVQVMVELSSRLYDAGDTEGQRRFLAQAEAIARAGNRSDGVALVHCLRAMSFADDGLPDSARAQLAAGPVRRAWEDGRDSALSLMCHDAEGKILLAEGRPREAIAAMRLGLAAADSSERQQALSMLAEALRANGETREAARVHRQILDELLRAGYVDADAIGSVSSFATSEMAELGELAALDSMLHDLVRRQEAVLGPGKASAFAAFLYGQNQLRLGLLDSAEVWNSRAARSSDPGGPLAAWMPPTLAELRFQLGQIAEARAAVVKLPDGTPTRLVNRALYAARLRWATGDRAGAFAVMDSAIKANPRSGRVLPALTQLLLTAAEWRLQAGDPTGADSLARIARDAAATDSLALARSAWVAWADLTLAHARLAQGDRAGARDAAARSLAASSVGNGPTHPRTVAARALRDSIGL